MPYINQVIILQCGPLRSIIAPFQIIYLGTQLKGEFTDLF